MANKILYIIIISVVCDSAVLINFRRYKTNEIFRSVWKATRHDTGARAARARVNSRRIDLRVYTIILYNIICKYYDSVAGFIIFCFRFRALFVVKCVCDDCDACVYIYVCVCVHAAISNDRLLQSILLRLRRRY